MCSYGDLDLCSVWREEPRKARKAHECDGCGAGIAPGDVYLVHANVFDGTATTEKMCAACWCVRQSFVEAHGQSRPPSALAEMLRDCIGENDDADDQWRPLLASVLRRYRISPGRRARLAKRREVSP